MLKWVKNKSVFLCIILFLCHTLMLRAQEIINISLCDGEDATCKIREAVMRSRSDQIKIVFQKGVYYCLPDYAVEKYCAISNHGNGTKKILFSLESYKSVEIVGNGATLLFHGQIMPFLFENCQSVSVKGLTIDWDIPFTFLGEVVSVNSKEGWREIKPFKEGFSWKLEKGEIKFPCIDGFNYTCLGSTLPFEKETKRVVHGAIDIDSEPSRVERTENGNLRIYEKLHYYPPVGSLLSSKGDRDHDRYAPAFDFKECRSISLDSITIHHALGMGFLFERSENIRILNSQVVLPEHTQRVISTTADATHFVNCKGDILIENCRFENMLDDGTNVHGTYVEVDKVIDDHTVRVVLKHFEQSGFKFAGKGDDVWFILHPSPQRQVVNTVDSVFTLNERFIRLSFTKPLPAGLKKGDMLENKTWNPAFTMRGCTIRNHRARSVILKTPLKTVIENNYFSSMMSAILLRGETHFWFESGAVEDVLIQNNTFENCADCGTRHAVLYVTPRLGKQFDPTQTYDRNIRFINNTINSFNPRVIWADRVEGLLMKGNRIIRNTEKEPIFPRDPVYELVNCRNVRIEDNLYSGKAPFTLLKADAVSQKTCKISP